MDTFTLILEIIGTIAFASSGAMIAIQKKMDILFIIVILPRDQGNLIKKDLICLKKNLIIPMMRQTIILL